MWTPLAIIAGLAALAPLAAALKPPIVRPTDPLVGGVDLRGFTPKPTSAPRLPFELVRRAGTAAAASSGTGSFIGWVGGVN